MSVEIPMQISATSNPLSGKTAIVTGSSRGIGRSTVLALAGAGASVIGVSRSQDRAAKGIQESLTDRVAKCGSIYRHIQGDVREGAVAQAAAAAAIQINGHIDILVNNAGVGSYADFDTYREDDYDEIMDTNMRSTFVFTKEVIPVMKRQGAGLILQIASQAGLRGFPREAIYCASKHAQVGFTRALRLELQPFGVKVGVICPAGVRTDFALNRGRTPEFIASAGFLEADDVADGVLFMATQSAKSRVVEMGLISLDEGI
jgi:NAD(P)-dependent dehydrogenase (short-subunit alcohol dehydrogenase family)